jgi:MarR family transcriptional regulator, organic hydroperoxide resistance regulator
MAAVRSRASRAPTLEFARRALQADPSTTVELDEVLHFMRVLWATVHALQKTSKRMSRSLGVTGPQRLVIRVVGLAPGISAGGLARILHLHPSTLTGVLKRLESQRLVSRVQHAGDGRRAFLRLTVAGQRLDAATAGTVEATVRTTLRQVDERDRRTVSEVLELLAERLDAGAVAPARKSRPRARPA